MLRQQRAKTAMSAAAAASWSEFHRVMLLRSILPVMQVDDWYYCRLRWNGNDLRPDFAVVKIGNDHPGVGKIGTDHHHLEIVWTDRHSACHHRHPNVSTDHLVLPNVWIDHQKWHFGQFHHVPSIQSVWDDVVVVVVVVS